MKLTIEFKADGELVKTVEVDGFEPEQHSVESFQWLDQSPLTIKGRRIDSIVRLGAHEVCLKALELPFKVVHTPFHLRKVTGTFGEIVHDERCPKCQVEGCHE